MLQRKCGCGTHTIGGGQCDSCGKKRSSILRRAAVNSLPVDVQRLARPGGNGEIVEGTNYAFDTYKVTEAHLSDPDIIARFKSLSKAELIDYQKKVRDLAVQDYIAQLLAAKPSVPCTADEISRTNAQAEAARTASLPSVSLAQRALDRLHSSWINNKADILTGKRSLSGQVVCAFDSNFNISQTDPNYGVMQIRVAQRLKQLASRLGRMASYSCQPDDDSICTGDNRDTVAYVRGGQPPIHFCPQFRDDPDELSQQSTVIHEYSHLLPGVHDHGGYAFGGLGAQSTTCTPNFKFKAPPDVLASTADALTGFVMHIGQMNATEVAVAQGPPKSASEAEAGSGADERVAIQASPTEVSAKEAKAHKEGEGPKASIAAGGQVEVGKETTPSADISVEAEVPLWLLQTKRTFGGSHLKFFNQLTIKPGIGFKPGDETHRLFTPLVLEGSLKMFSIEWEKGTRAGLFKFGLGGSALVGAEVVPQTKEVSVGFGAEAGGGLEWRPKKGNPFFVKIEAKAQTKFIKKTDMKLEWQGVFFVPGVKLGVEF